MSAVGVTSPTGEHTRCAATEIFRRGVAMRSKSQYCSLEGAHGLPAVARAFRLWGALVLAPLAIALVSLALAACASGGGAPDASVPRDLGPSDGGPRDLGPVDMAFDSGRDLCTGIVCAPFEYCDRGSCRSYSPCTPAGGCVEPGFVCRNSYCLPEGADVDGDGAPAATDCDETNPMIRPGADDVCNGVDDDCSGTPDDGPPGVVCPAGEGECIAGVCGCPAGRLDLDRVPENGCECEVLPEPGAGGSCDAPIDLGDVPDTGVVQTATGNLVPVGREVWYRFRGVDTPDTNADRLDVRVAFADNPEGAFEFTVFRGGCGMPACADEGYQEYSFSTNFLMGPVGPGAVGENPCGVPHAPSRNLCADQTAEYFVRVRRKEGVMPTCAP
jgi:hypothetical protein